MPVCVSVHVCGLAELCVSVCWIEKGKGADREERENRSREGDRYGGRD